MNKYFAEAGSCSCVLQEISRLQSELSNLKSQIEMQTNSVQVIESSVTALQNELNHVSRKEYIHCHPLLRTKP